MSPYRMRLMAAACGVLAAICILAGCSRGDADASPTYGGHPATRASAPEYTFGIFPLRDAAHLVERYQPLVDEINLRAELAGSAKLRLELSRDQADFASKLRDKRLSVAIVNPGMAVRFEGNGYRIFAKASDDDRFRGILLVRKNSDIRELADLRGRRISFPAPTSVAATMLNKMFLYDHGLNIERDASPFFCDSQDSANLNLFEGVSDAAGTWPPGWETMQRDRPDVAAALEVRWQTGPLVQLAVIAGEGLPDNELAVVRDGLFHLQDSETGRRILTGINVRSYEPATSEMYEPVRKFLTRYEGVFGKVSY